MMKQICRVLVLCLAVNSPLFAQAERPTDDPAKAASATKTKVIKFCALSIVYEDTDNDVALFYCINSDDDTCAPAEEAYCWEDLSLACPQLCENNQCSIAASIESQGGSLPLPAREISVLNEDEQHHLKILHPATERLAELISHEWHNPVKWYPNRGLTVLQYQKAKITVKGAAGGDKVIYASLYYAKFDGRSGNPALQKHPHRCAYGIEHRRPVAGQEEDYEEIEVSADNAKTKYSVIVPFDGLSFVVFTKTALK